MKVLYINSFNFGSTGNLCINLAGYLNEKGHKSYMCVPRSRSNQVKKKKADIYIGNRISRNIHEMLGYFTGLQGSFSLLSTINFLRKIEKIQPDIIHLHNLHNCYINLPLLFLFLKKAEIPVVWTLHDCWAFTGKCPHFVIAKCTKWRTGCGKCPQLKKYPDSFLDASRHMWSMKKRWFTSLEKMMIITPSRWLEELVGQSYLQKYPKKTIYNGIDLNVFKRTDSCFRKKIKGKKIILGVSMTWGYAKGLDVFVELSKILSDDYRIVLVGANESTIKDKPDNIMIVDKTNNQSELADIYSSADVFVNPTREEVLGLVNIEALACGTPVITFNSGGSPETIDDSCGKVINVDDIDTLRYEIERICNDHPYTIMDCRRRAEIFSNYNFTEQYRQTYEELLRY